MKRNRKLLKVPIDMSRTDRWKAEATYVFPRRQSFPIADLFHARDAVQRVITWPNMGKVRGPVVRKVQAEWPEYNWSVYWTFFRNKNAPTNEFAAKLKKQGRTWKSYLKTKAYATANPYYGKGKDRFFVPKAPKGLKYKVFLANKALEKARKTKIIFPIKHEREIRYYVGDGYHSAKVTYSPPTTAQIMYSYMEDPDDDVDEAFYEEDTYYLTGRGVKGKTKKDFEKRLDQIVASVDKHLKNPMKKKNPRRRRNAEPPKSDWVLDFISSEGTVYRLKDKEGAYRDQTNSQYYTDWTLYHLPNGKWIFFGGDSGWWDKGKKGYTLSEALKLIKQFDDAYRESWEYGGEEGWLKNSRRRKGGFAIDWVLPQVQVAGQRGKWFLEVYAPQGGRFSRAKSSRRHFLKSNNDQSYIKMGKTYKTKAEAKKQRLYFLDQIELYLDKYYEYPNLIAAHKEINPRKKSNPWWKPKKGEFYTDTRQDDVIIIESSDPQGFHYAGSYTKIPTISAAKTAKLSGGDYMFAGEWDKAKKFYKSISWNRLSTKWKTFFKKHEFSLGHKFGPIIPKKKKKKNPVDFGPCKTYEVDAKGKRKKVVKKKNPHKTNRRRTRRYALKNPSEASQAMTLYHDNKDRGMTLKEAWAIVKN